MKNKIYICGIVNDSEDTIYKFNRAEEYLKKTGYDPINPVNLNFKDRIRELVQEDCNHIYLLEGWNYSTKAQLEIAIAELNNYLIIRQKHNV